MFTMDNTDGYTAGQLAILNAALEIRLARGEDEKSASDAITNAWGENGNVSDLV